MAGLWNPRNRSVFIDTRACANADATPISFRYHIIIIAAELLALIPFYSWTDRAYFSMIIVFAICTVIVSVFGLVFHIYMNRRQNQAYSFNSDINTIVNLTIKKYIASAMLVMSLLNFVAWITFVLMCIIQDTVDDLSFWMYIILQLLSGCTLTVILILARNRKNECLRLTHSRYLLMMMTTGRLDFTTILMTRTFRAWQAVFDQLLA